MIPNRPLTVVTLIDLLEGAGAERTAVELALRLDRDRFRPVVCASRAPECAAADRLRAEGVPLLRLARTSSRSLGAWKPLVQLLRRGGAGGARVDILHAHKFGSNTWGVALGRLSRVPVVIATEHTWSYQGRPVRKAVDHVIGRTSSAFVAVSEEDRRRMISVERVPASRIRVIPTGLVPHANGEEAAEVDVRAELGLAPTTPVVGTVCAVREQKRLDVLLRAFSTVRESLPDARLLIVGDGPDYPRLQKDVATLFPEGSVLLLGRRDDVPSVLRAMDVFAISSDFEGSPLALIEAMAQGVPIVATRVGGVPDILGGDEVCGLLVPPGDPGSLADALLRVFRDPVLRQDLGSAGVERAGSEYTFDRVVERWESLYTELADRARGRRRRP